mgnify:CR=1 FL=1
MKLKELIEKYKKYEGKWNAKTGELARQIFLEDLQQLDEPQPVKVPPFVADWIEHFKKTGDWDLFQAMDYLFGKKEIREWLEYKNNQETFARAWLDGYEVEKEKRYFVKITATKHYISKDGIGKIFFSLAYKESFTKKELEEAGFGWVFDCPGIEIEEVE